MNRKHSNIDIRIPMDFPGDFGQILDEYIKSTQVVEPYERECVCVCVCNCRVSGIIHSTDSRFDMQPKCYRFPHLCTVKQLIFRSIWHIGDAPMEQPCNFKHTHTGVGRYVLILLCVFYLLRAPSPELRPRVTIWFL